MAAVNKNFVIKNGLEVDTNLIVADSQTNKVGIGTTVPQYILHVNGGIGVTNAYVSGITTVINELRVGTGGTVLTVLGVGNSIGIGTALPAFLLDVRAPVSTGATALYVQGDVRITGDLVVQDDLVLDEVTSRNITVSNQATTLNLSATGVGTITTLNSTSGTITNLTSTNLTGTSGTITTLNSTSGTITNLTGTAGTITTFNSTNLRSTNLNVTGISTLGTVKISSGIVTATSGVVTYFGDGRFLNLTSNPSRGIGIGTTGGLVGYAVTFINFKGSGVSTAQYNSSTGIATIFFEGGGGGGGGSISISTTAPISPGSGDLWYSPDYGRTFIYYDESVVGYGTDAFWVDAAPFNTGISPVIGVGIQSAGVLVGTGITVLNFTGAGNTFAISGTTANISIAGGGIGEPTGDVDGIFSYVSAAATITQNITFDATNAGASNSYVISVIPSITIGSGVAVTVGAGKTTIIDVLNLAGLTTSL
jgi:hypothetical protein